jgi:hypothetical protein
MAPANGWRDAKLSETFFSRTAMQELGTDRAFVEDQYSDAAKLRTRIETHVNGHEGVPTGGRGGPR